MMLTKTSGVLSTAEADLLLAASALILLFATCRAGPCGDRMKLGVWSRVWSWGWPLAFRAAWDARPLAGPLGPSRWH